MTLNQSRPSSRTRSERLLDEARLALGPRLARHLDEAASLADCDPSSPEWIVTVSAPGRLPIEVRLGLAAGHYERVAWLAFCDDDSAITQAPFRVRIGRRRLYASCLRAAMAMAKSGASE